MDNEKMNKKGSSLYSVVTSIVFVILIFSGMFLFYTDQLDKNSETLDTKYNTTYNQLLEVQTNLDNRVDSIKTAADEVREADSTFLAAINGFKGMGQAMLLMLGFTSDSIDITQALLLSTDVIPSWVQSLIVVSIIAFIIFLIIDLLMGRKSLIK